MSHLSLERCALVIIVKIIVFISPSRSIETLALAASGVTLMPVFFEILD